MTISFGKPLKAIPARSIHVCMHNVDVQQLSLVILEERAHRDRQMFGVAHVASKNDIHWSHKHSTDRILKTTVFHTGPIHKLPLR
jgi:hypothetical protein